MGDFTAVRPNVYVTGAVIYAANHNLNETTLYTAHNNAFNASTGHGHTGATGDGPKLTSTGLDLTAAYPWTGSHTWTAAIGVAATVKFYLDGVALTGDTYIQESSANNMLFMAGGVSQLQLTATNATFNGDILVQATKKLYLDGGTNTYLYENPGDAAVFVCGGVDSFTIRGNSIAINATDRIYLDGRGASGNTYICESTADNMLFMAGGVSQLQLTATNATFNGDILVQATKKLYLDGGTNTYLYENPGDAAVFVCGGVDSFTIRGNSIAINATDRIYLDGRAATGNTYLSESSADTVTLVCGGTTIQTNSSTGMVALCAAQDPPTANYLTRGSLVKAWAEMSSAGALSGSGYNVLNPSQTATGKYSIDFDTDFSTASFAIVVSCPSANSTSDVRVANYINDAVGSVSIFVQAVDAATPFDFVDSITHFIAIGDQ